MGTSIDVLFRRPEQFDAERLTDRLNACFARSIDDLSSLQSHAWYSTHQRSWTLTHVPADGNEPSYFYDEGPFGFDVHLYSNVILLSHAERFGRAHFDDSPVAKQIQRLIDAVVVSVCGDASFCAVAAGMGDSDVAVDLAYYKHADLSAVTESLTDTLGQPCLTWDDLNGDSGVWLNRGAGVR
ncbi:MAG: hypothetical protein WAO83_09940 [Fuerstiella sp.]